MLDEEGRALLRQCLTVSTPDRPVTLAASHGDAVTHFTRGTFNLTDRAMNGIPAHGYRSAQGKEQA